MFVEQFISARGEPRASSAMSRSEALNRRALIETSSGDRTRADADADDDALLNFLRTHVSETGLALRCTSLARAKIVFSGS